MQMQIDAESTRVAEGLAERHPDLRLGPGGGGGWTATGDYSAGAHTKGDAAVYVALIQTTK